MYIFPPDERLRAKDFEIKITASHCSVGIKGNPPYLDLDLGGMVDTAQSLWMLEDGELCITLHKMRVGETWAGAFEGHGNEAQQKADQEKLMLERFQRENPQFDFSGAQFQGAAPDPRKFMGGVDTNKLKP